MTQLRTSDLIYSFILGALIFVFLLPVDRSIGLFDSLGIGAFLYTFGALLPFCSAFGYFVLYLISKKIPVVIQLARYGLIGVFNTVASMGIISFVDLRKGGTTGYEADMYAAIAFVIVVTNSFFWNKYWTFDGAVQKKTTTEYIQFFVVSLSGALLNTVVFHIVVNIIGNNAGIDLAVSKNIAVAIGIPLSFIWNFFGYKFFVFRKKDGDVPSQITQV